MDLIHPIFKWLHIFAGIMSISICWDARWRFQKEGGTGTYAESPLLVSLGSCVDVDNRRGFALRDFLARELGNGIFCWK